PNHFTFTDPKTDLYFRVGRVAPYNIMRKLCHDYSGIPANPSTEDLNSTKPVTRKPLDLISLSSYVVFEDEYLDVVNDHLVFLGVRYTKGQIDAEQQNKVNFVKGVPRGRYESYDSYSAENTNKTKTVNKEALTNSANENILQVFRRWTWFVYRNSAKVADEICRNFDKSGFSNRCECTSDKWTELNLISGDSIFFAWTVRLIRNLLTTWYPPTNRSLTHVEHIAIGYR
ncbi:hypothetical protein CLF_100614, partial [Clonorchis sinensis]